MIQYSHMRMAIINLANSSLLNICYFLFSVLQTILQRASFYLYLCILNFFKCSINWNFRKKFNPKVTFLRGNCGNTNPYARTDDSHKPDYPRKRLCILIQVSVTFPKLAHFSKIFFLLFRFVFFFQEDHKIFHKFIRSYQETEEFLLK